MLTWVISNVSDFPMATSTATRSPESPRLCTRQSHDYNDSEGWAFAAFPSRYTNQFIRAAVADTVGGKSRFHIAYMNTSCHSTAEAMSRCDDCCHRCRKPLEQWKGTYLGYGGLWHPGVYCSPNHRDLNDQVWLEWHAAERR